MNLNEFLEAMNNRTTNKFSLHSIVKHDTPEAVRHALHCGDDANAINQWGRTPLHVAAQRGNLAIVRELLSKNKHSSANPNIQQTLFGCTPIHVAAYAGHLEIVVELLKHVGVNIRAGNGETPLFGAICSGNIALITLLLENNANTNVMDTRRQTPQTFALYYSRNPREILSLLKQY